MFKEKNRKSEPEKAPLCSVGGSSIVESVWHLSSPDVSLPLRPTAA